MAIGRVVMYYAHDAHTFSAGIKCWHCRPAVLLRPVLANWQLSGLSFIHEPAYMSVLIYVHMSHTTHLCLRIFLESVILNLCFLWQYHGVRNHSTKNVSVFVGSVFHSNIFPTDYQSFCL